MADQRPSNQSTVRELAAALNLSKSTVADALRNNPKVSASTRARVQQYALEAGYQPSPLISSLLQRVRNRNETRYQATLAYLYVLPPTWRPFFSQNMFYEGARHRAEQLGYKLDSFNMFAQGMTPKRLSDILRARGILGVIVGPHTKNAWKAELDWKNFAAIGFALSVRRPPICRISHNHHNAIQLIFRMCRRKGVRKIGLLLEAGMDVRVNFGWSSSYRTIQHHQRPQYNVPELILKEKEFTTANIHKWIDKYQPEAIACLKGRLPKDWQLPDLNNGLKPLIVNLDIGPQEHGCGIDQQHMQCGALAIENLSGKILHNQRGLPSLVTTIYVDGIWRGNEYLK